jgi:type IV pilus assembly protein PilC
MTDQLKIKNEAFNYRKYLKPLTSLSIFKFRQTKYEDKEILAEFEERRRNFWEIEIGRPVPQGVLLQVTRQLAAFTSAGIPIIDAINLLATTTKNKRMKQVLIDMGRAVNGGLTLPQAVKLNSKVFPEYYVAILDASERSGDLTSAFETLGSYLERDLASVRAVKSALYYPIILIALSIITIAVLCAVVLPRFSVLFASLGLSLPWATRALMNFSIFVSTWWWLLSLGLILSIAAFFYFYRRDRGRLAIDNFVLKIPIFGSVLELIALERFSRVLGSLADAGVPLPDALLLSASATGNRRYENSVKATREGVLQGQGLADPLEATKTFPAEAIQIIRVGEQSGQLVQQLGHAAEYYAKEVDFKLKNITSLIEPVILLVVGGGVGFVAIALVSAMYGIYSGSAGIG